jgi:hypothetical protein
MNHSCCIARQKKWLYHLPQSQNNCIKIFGLCGNSATRDEVQLGGVTQLARLMCRVNNPYPSPPHFYLSDMRRDFILSAEEQFLS